MTPFSPLGATYRGLFELAIGNVNSNADAEYLALAAGSPFQFTLKLFSTPGSRPTLLGWTTFQGAQQVAIGDVVGGDGIDELLVGSDQRIDVFSGTGRFFFTVERFPLGPISGLATGDFNRDGVDEILVGGPGDHVQVFSTAGGAPSLVGQGAAFGQVPMGGVSVAGGDVNGDGIADVIVGAGSGFGPQVRAFDISGPSPLVRSDFSAFESTFRGGVGVASVDLNGDGKAEILTGSGPGKSTELQAWETFQDFLGVRMKKFWGTEANNPFGAGYLGGLDVAAVLLVAR